MGDDCTKNENKIKEVREYAERKFEAVGNEITSIKVKVAVIESKLLFYASIGAFLATILANYIGTIFPKPNMADSGKAQQVQVASILPK